MPVPPLPENNTGRVIVGYTTGRETHTLIFRYGAGATPTQAIDRVRLFLLALQSQLPNTWTVIDAQAQAAGAVVTLPVSLGTLAGFTGSSALPIDVRREPLQWNFIGRGITSGRRTRVGLYGLTTDVANEYRYVGSGITGPFANAITVLQNGGNIAPVTIAGDAVDWYDYVNVQYNSYWERRQRG